MKKPVLGILLKALSALAFTLMSAGLKVVSAAYPTGELVFFRSAFALVPLLAWLGWQGDLVEAIRTRDIGGHVLRGIIGSCGMFSGFAALTFLPLSDAVALGYAAPLMVVVLAALVLKERHWGADALETMHTTENLARVLVELGRRAEARTLAQRCLAVYRRSYPAHHRRISGLRELLE